MIKNNSKQKILVVDDIPELRVLLSTHLELAGYHVFVAANGNEAFKIAKSEDVGVVITDKEMPNGDGFELLSRLKARNVTNPAVIVMTGSSGPVAELAYAMGAEAVFKKPFSYSILLDAIRRFSMPISDRLERIPSEVLASVEPGFKIEYNKLNDGSKCLIGRGGMFVRSDSTISATGTQLSFLIDIADINKGSHKPSIVEGIGTVRWIRNEIVPGFPTGYGLEFDYLPKHAINDLRKWSVRQGIIPFIPNGR